MVTHLGGINHKW